MAAGDPDAPLHDPAEAPHDSLVAAIPGLARIAAGAYVRTAEWTLGASLRLGSRVMKAAVSGESAAELLQDVGGEARGAARRLLGLADIEDRARALAPVTQLPRRGREAGRSPEPSPEDLRSLRDRGTELLRRSADVRYEEPAHPAYERILGELAPDEGRILRLLALDGPQPAVDVRSSKTFNVSSQLVAPGLSMIGQTAGCRYLDRVPAYLNNLFRLGLIWFSREPLEDPLRYQVLEAQPDVLQALKSSPRGRTVRRTIHLTPFGVDFCRVCLPLETAELDTLPAQELVEPDELSDPELSPQG